MTTEEFNELWHKIAEKELLPSGFIRIGNSYLTIQGTTIFQFSKNTQKTEFHGFLFGYTHTFFESWADEFPNKWPINLEQLCFVLPKSKLEKIDLENFESKICLALDYSNGKENLHLDFPETELSQSEILESVLLAKTKGLALAQKLTTNKTRQILEGRVSDSFMPNRWLAQLKTLPNIAC